jgi:O-antigen ligase
LTLNVIGTQAIRSGPTEFSAARSGIESVKAATIFGLFALLPLVFTLYFHTYLTNRYSAVLLLAGAWFLGARFNWQLLRPPASHRLGLIVLFAGVCCVAWQWQIGDLWLNSQFFLYLGIAAAYPLTLKWFRATKSVGFDYVFLWKLAGALGATLLFLPAIAETEANGGIGYLLREPPIYGDARHYSHDQLFVLAIGAFFFARAAGKLEKIFWLCLCVVVAYPLFWSGGRAAIGALGLFLAICFAGNFFSRRAIALWVLALLAALALLVATDRDYLLFSQLTRTAETVSSGRFEIWINSLRLWSDNWASTIFGFGPDAMRMTVRIRTGFPPVVQPHNTIVQVLIEFGLVGLLLFGFLSALVVRRIVEILFARSAPKDVRMTAALLTALLPYMLVDGILYYSIPLIMVMFLTAYLFHFDLDPSEKLGSRARSLWSSCRSTFSGR